MNLLDRNSNPAILLAGIVTLIVGVGVARFAFTSFLPYMLEDGLDITFAGVLASLNFAGYLSGSIFAVFIKDINAKVKFFRVGMVLCVGTTIILGVTTNEVLWIVSRIIAGFGSAMALVVGSAIVMSKLNFEDKTKAMGIHFSGIGFSIIVSEILMRSSLNFGFSWEKSWIVLAIFGLLGMLYGTYILSFDKAMKVEAVKHKFDITLFTPFVILLIMAYFTEGVGFVVQGTFLPDIINSLAGLEGMGNLVWSVVGLAGIPSSIIWMRLAAKYGSVTIIIVAMMLQIVGILIPTFTSSVVFNLLSGVLYGGTFIGLVALFMSLGGRLAGKNPVVLMGALTTAYGVGQVSAPLYSVTFIEKYGNYDIALYLTGAIVLGGVFLLLIAKKIDRTL